MATSTPSAAALLASVPALAAPGTTGVAARCGAAPAGSFASLLDQLGQPAPINTAAVSIPVTDTATPPTATTVNQPAPAVTPPPSVILPPSATLPSSAAMPQIATPASEPAPQAPAANPGASPKAADKKPKLESTIDAATSPPLPPVAETTAPAPPVPTMEAATPVPPVPVVEAATPVPLAPAAPTPAEPPSSGSAPQTTAATAPAPTALDPSPLNTSSAPTLAAPAASKDPSPPLPSRFADNTPTPSRVADQAAAKTQAGLPTRDDSVDVEPPELSTPPQPANGVAANAVQIPVAPPLPSAPPQFAAAPSAPATAAAPVRTGLASARTAEPDTPSPPSPSYSPSSEPVQPAQSTAADTPTPSQAATINALAAAAPAPLTRPAPPAAAASSPAAQVAQVIAEPVKIVMTSSIQAGPSTPHVTTIQITPAELGRVDVRIERIDGGAAKIQLVAERPETLSRLVHDQSQLQQALDQAGIPQNGRTLEFSLAPAATDNNAFASTLSGSNASNGESASNGFQRPNHAYYRQTTNEADEAKPTSTQPRSVRTGIDITA